MKATGKEARSQTYQEIRSSFRKKLFSSKDLEQLVVPLSEFNKHYQTIVAAYTKEEPMKFIAFEICIMIARLMIENNARVEAIGFVNFSIYITNLAISEEIRVNFFFLIHFSYSFLLFL
jgi:hypothetical protein